MAYVNEHSTLIGYDPGSAHGRVRRAYVSPARRDVPGRGLSDATTTTALGEQIVCEAIASIGVVEVPLGSNSGGGVDAINLYYFGSKAAQPWCTSSVWYWVDRAVKAMGGTNTFPGASVAWGNARKTLEASRKVLRVDKSPARGAAFYRTSTTPGDGSSGHMGIVEAWDGSTLMTIEGNAGSSNNVSRYTYKGKVTSNGVVIFDPSGNDYGFEFIHVELIAVARTTPVSSCRPTASGTPSSGTSSSGTSSSSAPSSGGASSGGASSGGTASGATSLVRREQPIEQRCTEIKVKSITLPATGMMKHYSELKNRVVAADIVGANFGDVPPERRNGSATTPSGGTGREDFSGLTVMTDRNGNLIYVTVESFGQYATMRDHKLWGRGPNGGPAEPYTFRFSRYFGSNAYEQTAEALMGQRSPQVNMADMERRTKQGKFWAQDFQGRRLAYDTPIELLQQIEAIGRRLDQPIVILLTGEPFTWKSFLDLALKIFDMASRYLGLFGVQISDTMLKLRSAVQYLVTNKGGVDLNTIPHLFEIASAIAPGAVKPYIDKGRTVYQSAIQGNWDSVARELGIDITEASRWANAAIRSSDLKEMVAGIEQVVAKANVGFETARATLQGALNMRMVARVRSSLESGWLVQQFLRDEEAKIGAVPEMQELLLTGAAGKLLPLVPQIGGFLGPVIHRAQELTPGSPGFNEQIRGLALSSIGIPPGDPAFTGELFSSMTLAALQNRVENYAAQGLKAYTLPAGVPDDKRECWAWYISQKTGVTVLTGTNGTTPSSGTPKSGTPQSGGSSSSGTSTSSSTSLFSVRNTTAAGSTSGSGISIVPDWDRTFTTGTNTITSANRVDLVATPTLPTKPVFPVTQPTVPVTPGKTTVPSLTLPNLPPVTIVPHTETPRTETPRTDFPRVDIPAPPPVKVPVTKEPAMWEPGQPSIPPSDWNPPGDTLRVPVIECPPGTHFDPDLKACVPDTPPRQEMPRVDSPRVPVIECPPGFHFDLELKACVPDEPPVITTIRPPERNVPIIPSTPVVPNTPLIPDAPTVPSTPNVPSTPTHPNGSPPSTMQPGVPSTPGYPVHPPSCGCPRCETRRTGCGCQSEEPCRCGGNGPCECDGLEGLGTVWRSEFW